MLPELEDFELIFHESYKINPDYSKKKDWKLNKKKLLKSFHKQKKKLEYISGNDIQGAPDIELPGNASAFAVFASIRLSVLDRWMQKASQKYLLSSCNIPLQDQSELESDTEENSQSSSFVPIKVSKIVGLGLKSVFEIIKESRIIHPGLCTKALKALFDILQGQAPEAFKTEPPEVIDSLFDILMDLATLHGPESTVPNDGNHIIALACSCLLSLVVVRGDTGKYLTAVAALLMCPRVLTVQNIQMPAVLSTLQRSVHGILLGKVIRPDWLTHGVPVMALVDSFHIKLPNEFCNDSVKLKSLATNGQYLYLYTSKGLLKVGSGYGGTVKGHVAAWKPEFYPNDNGNLVFCNGHLYLKLNGRKGCELLIVDKDNLLITGSVPLHNRDASASVLFSDGDNLGTILPAKDEGFVVRILNQNTSPASVINELPLKLARKCIDVFGVSSFDEDIGIHTVISGIGNDDEIATICAGKEFALIRTVTGKVLYSGKSSALGIKHVNSRTGKWSELGLTKTPKIIQIAVGHDGMHALFLTEDGSVFFTGTARRGEDGDQNKLRRQPKPVKPKKLIKVDGQIVTFVACNNGTTALVNNLGELMLYGKDTSYVDSVTGVVTALKGEFVTQVALGKAHAVALTKKGTVYTFGINNKFQCGREFVTSTKEENISNVIAMDTCGIQEEQEIFEEIIDESQKNNFQISDGNVDERQHNICPPGLHTWHDDMCMICTVCRECTGYSFSCMSMSAERNPGQECGCGEGDSGCAECGCCRICAREVVDNSELADLAGMMKLDLIFRDTTLISQRQKSRLQEQLQMRLEERKNRSKKAVQGSSKAILKSKSLKQANNAVAPHGGSICNNTRHTNILSTVKEQVVCDVERDNTKVSCLPPAELNLPFDCPVIQVACGLHHSLLLLQNGQVYTFGSNLYGQLGCGDILTKNTLQYVKLPCNAVSIAAGSNHSVILTTTGEVYTFGNGHKGQLGRSPSVSTSQDSSQPGNSSNSHYSNIRTSWYSTPGAIPNIGRKHGRRATWIGASGDQTFIKLDESLINSTSISKSAVTANKYSIVLLPSDIETAKNFKCIVINRRDGNCNSFKEADQVDFSNKVICMDYLYNVLWSYDILSNEMSYHNIIASELQMRNTVKSTNSNSFYNVKVINDTTSKNKKNLLGAILSPELALPITTNCLVTRFQAAINLLCCIDILTVAHDSQLVILNEVSEERQLISGKNYSREDFMTVNRFENHGGGWGYSGHSIEAIRFMADTDILLGGFGLFGGRGEYTAKIKLLDIGTEGGEQESDGELLVETEEIPYECGPRQKFPILFDEPVHLQANRWYVAWCRISGPSSDCGSSGQAMVTTEDQVVFYFKSSKASNNGTDVNAGQIPQLLYKIMTPENLSSPKQMDFIEPMHILTKEFSKAVSKQCFQSLLSLLQWSWNTFKWGICERQSLKNIYTNLELERLVYITKASLRIICTYTNEIYPRNVNKKCFLENVQLAECVADVRTLLKQILSDNIPVQAKIKRSNKANFTNLDMINSILKECHNTFVQCFHAFYPTPYLKWICLCDLLGEVEKENSESTQTTNQTLLGAVLCALSAPSVRLRCTFPLIGNGFNSECSIRRGISSSDNNGLPMMNVSENHCYPILVEQMTYKSQLETSGTIPTSWQWNEVLDALLQLVSQPVVKSLSRNDDTALTNLDSYCCNLLARVLAELVHQCNAAEEDLQGTCGRTLHVTPSRFTKTNQSRTWNTGNGSPDAISFQVDRPGISIVGIGMYGGIGHYEYELEILEDVTSVSNIENHAHTHRWNSLDISRGSFGPEDFAPEIIEIKFDRVIPVKENIKYAIRLRNHGGRTNNGDGGLNSVKGSDGTMFTYSTCSLSFNGTTLTRGQIPIILYYSQPSEYGRVAATKMEQQARNAALSMMSSIIQKTTNLMILAREKAEEVCCAEILNKSSIINILLPLVLSHISPLATIDSRSAVYILSSIHQILPHVTALNLNCAQGNCFKGEEQLTCSSNLDTSEFKVTTTSRYYTLVESEHPYKPSTVNNYRVVFPESVKWMSLEFDSACSTIQPEDSLQIYIPAIEYVSEEKYEHVSLDEYDSAPIPVWPVLNKFCGSFQWPTNSVLIPGNEVLFSLETASDYLKDEKLSAYGFKCLIIGYDWPHETGSCLNSSLKQLEAELSFLGGMCAASLMKKEIILPSVGDNPEVDVESAEGIASEIFSHHGRLLSKGLSLSTIPTVQQALDGILPYSAHSNERLFLRDFVNCVEGSCGGRLAQWLQPGSRVDLTKCQILYSRSEFIRGWPSVITVVTRDQYGDIVFVPDMKVEVKASPVDRKEINECDGRKMRRLSEIDNYTFGGLSPPALHHPYEPTIRDRMCFLSITAMKVYQNYSFEELRYASPPMKRTGENMLVRGNSDGTYFASWTPSATGCFSIIVNIDGYDLEEVFKVDVMEPPQGMTPPNHNLAKKSSHQPSKLRKFVSKYSAGLRIRAHPSLQSEQIGIVHVDGTIAFIDEIHNDDGVWLRLSAETIKQYCNICVIEAWCLQYNQHIGRTLLFPVEEPKSILDHLISDTISRLLPEIQTWHSRNDTPNATVNYQVIKCGASGHNVRVRPSLKAPPVGMLVLGNRIGVIESTVNSDGCWVKLDQTTKEKYCFDIESDAWLLAIDQHNILYLGNSNGSESQPNIVDPSFMRKNKRGFNFSNKSDETNFTFSTPKPASSTVYTNPFIFGVPGSPKLPKKDKKENKLSNIPKWFIENIKVEDVSQSNNSLVKSCFESGNNGNGVTPPESPRRCSSPKSRSLSQKAGKNSSALRHEFPVRASSQSDVDLVTSGGTTREIAEISSQISPMVNQASSMNESPVRSNSESSSQQVSNLQTENSDANKIVKKVIQTGTQTSPENATTQVKSNFSIGSTGNEERLSPKMPRKDRSIGKLRPKRSVSPINVQQLPSSTKTNIQTTEPIKQAMSPSAAESLRAVFAAFLWHEGIVHDAMACASFLKFHPSLPKQGSLATRNQEHPSDQRHRELTKEEKARQRHSVEVSNAGNYLHIQPSTLETLTRSAANASANRNRRKLNESVIKEEKGKLIEENYSYQTMSALPPALKYLVNLWEELTSICLQAFSNQMHECHLKARKTEGNDAREKNSVIEKEARRCRKKKIQPRNYLEDLGSMSGYLQSNAETLCELCGGTFQHPVTYHMRQMHPGCSEHASGKGYNSGGNYCLGWAGNCGDGGIPGSSWYLLCEACRNKYLKTFRNDKQTNSSGSYTLPKTLSSPSAPPPQEPHIAMKQNAMFLLELANSTDLTIDHKRRHSGTTLSSVSENITPPDYNGPFGPPPPFQCLQSLGISLCKDNNIFTNILRNHDFEENYNSTSSSFGQRPLSDIFISDSDSEVNKGLRFHRSVSMGTNGIPWSKFGCDGRVIMMRRRNYSSCEFPTDGGSSLLCNPSPALQRLIFAKENHRTNEVDVTNDDNESDQPGVMHLLQRPVMQFVLEHHDLKSLKFAMKQALRKATCKVYAMQALNWLLKSVTQPICLHDLLWWFVTSLSSAEVNLEEDISLLKKDDEQELNACEHPLSDVSLAGEAIYPLPNTFHTLLQTIADLMVLLPMGSALQQMAIKCWGIRFNSTDHSFLHRSQVFSNISKILSRSEEMEDIIISMKDMNPSFHQDSPLVQALKDFTSLIEIKASSRQAMVGSLTDNCTETFWESGDEDRNKTKTLTIFCPQGYHPLLVCIHIDNCRDLGNKISSVTFYCGQTTDELIKIRNVEVEIRLLGGWINCPIIDPNDSIIRLEIKGPDNSVRVRQLRVLGDIEGESLKMCKHHTATMLQQKNCEIETLRVFRLITSQVFGKLLHGEEGQNTKKDDENISNLADDSINPNEESNELREHMVGILFSRSKLTYLQKQVIVHIVQAIRKEAERLHIEWESNLNLSNSRNQIDEAVKNSDTYCFEMLSMVLALSGSSVGRNYLSYQGGLLADIVTLLHTGSARVQRQVSALLRRMLSEITPEVFANVLGVRSLPERDFSIVSVLNKDSNSRKFDLNETGILDVFLSLIAKALTLQVKNRNKNGNVGLSKETNTVTLAAITQTKDISPTRWWLKGTTSKKLAEGIICLIKDMAAGKISDAWSSVTKSAIAENILHLTYLSEDQRTPSVCLETSSLWLALASLCVLNEEHVDRLSSGQWTQPEGQPLPPRPTCGNHDDGETVAVVHCSHCGNLCADCDRYLHLHRKTRNHQRQVCKEEEEAIKVEIHEGCGRTKLFWLLALADPRTLKALIEFREGGTRTKGVGISGICRFCGTTENSGLLAISNVCADHECQEYGKFACTKLLSCGHMCGGILGETKCLPCLHGCSRDNTLRQDADDMCMICFTEALSCAPAIQLHCGHVFHLHCCKAALMKRWAGPRITFSFMLCPICKNEMKHEMLNEILVPILELFKDVHRKALMRLEYEGLHTAEAVVTPGARFYNDPAAYAMDRYAYYVCYKCKKAYYGGEARCDVDMPENYDPKELVCGACSDVARAQMCPKHGADFLEYKCRYCCSVAVFFCFGTTHFCNACHDDFQRVTNLPKNELPICPAGPKAQQLEGDECPLHIKHPPTGEEFALGCGVCRNAHTF